MNFGRKKKKTEEFKTPPKQFSTYTNFDRISPEVNMIITLKDMEKELFEMTNTIKVLLEKRSLILAERTKILSHLQAPTHTIDGLGDFQTPQKPQSKRSKGVTNDAE